MTKKTFLKKRMNKQVFETCSYITFDINRQVALLVRHIGAFCKCAIFHVIGRKCTQLFVIITTGM